MADRNLNIKIGVGVENAQGVDSLAKGVDALSDKLDTSLTQAAKKAGASLQESFKTLGVRSVEDIKAELEKVRAAMATVQSQSGAAGGAVAAAMRNGQAQVNALERELRAAQGQMTLMDRAAGLFRGTMGQFAAGGLIASGIAKITAVVADLGRQFIATNVQADQMRRGLTAVYKDGDVAASQISFLKKAAGDAGVSFMDLSRQFVSFSAATKSANVPLKVSNDLFAAVTRAGATLGLSSDRVSNALLALSQMASKGTVSMEELRQQLGEALPGALGLTAKSLGLTDGELIKLVESGSLAANDLFPALAQGLQQMAGDTDSTAGAWERFKNAITTAMTGAGAAGGINLMTVAVKGLAAVLAVVVIPLQGFAEVLFLAANAAGRIAATGDALVTSLLKWESPMEKLRLAWQGYGDEVAAAGGRVQETAAAFGQAIAPTQEQGKALSKATEEAAKLSREMLQLVMGYEKTAVAQKEAITNSNKSAEAVKQEGAAMVELAKLRGDEVGILQAQAQAAANNAAAAQKQAEAKQALLQTFQAELAGIQELTKGNEEELAAKKQKIEAIEKQIAATTEEVAAANAAAVAAEALAQKERVAAEVAKDHSGAVTQLTRAYEDAKAAYAAVLEQKQAGLASDAEVKAALDKMTMAEALYKDALKDTVAHLKTKFDTQKNTLSIEQLALQGKMDAINIEIKLARLAGDEQRVKQLLIAQKRIEIEQIKLSVKVKNLEADAAIATAQATMAELAASGKLTPEKKAEIDATIKLAKAKKELNAIKLQEVQLHEREINVLKGNTSGKRDNANSSKDAAEGIKRERTEREKNADAIQQENDRLKDLGLTRMGGGYMNKDKMATDRDGKVIQAAGWTRKQIIDWLVQFGMDSKLAEEQAKDFLDSYGNVKYMNNGGQLKWAGKGSTLTQALAKMGDYFVYGDGKNQNEKAKAAASGGAGSGMATSAGAGNTYVSNINLGGKNTTIKFADAQSQQQAEALLRELASAKGASY